MAILVAALAAGASPAQAATLVVDRDKAQCAQAPYTSIQQAVDAAQPGDLIRVCPDHYSESVVINKPLTLKGDPDAVEAIDCFQSTPSQLGDLDPTQQAVVDPADDGFSIALKLNANDVVVEGLVVEGASVGIDASDRFSGYHIDHNLIRHNALFSIDLGSEGTHASRVDHNCLRENQYGLVSELDDDSLWKPNDGPERDAWNARDLINARIDHNYTFRNRRDPVGAGLEAAGPGQRDLVTFDRNDSRDEVVGISLQNAKRSMIVENAITSSGFASIFLGGGNDGLDVDSNLVRGGGFGVRFSREEFIDVFPASAHLNVTENDVRGATAGIIALAGSLVESQIVENTTSDNLRIGINMLSSGNVVRANDSDNNGLVGINAFLGATGNRFEQNSMHGNAVADARDQNPLLNGMLQNVWTGNDCDKDIPAGMICGAG